GGFRRHQGGQGRVAQTVLDDISTQGFPIQVQRLVADTVHIFLVGVGRQQTSRVRSLIEGIARTVFARQLHRSLQQVVLDGFKRAVGQTQGSGIGVTGAILGQVVSVVDDANTQGTTLVGSIQRGLDRVVLVIQQSIQSTNNQFSQTVQLVQGLQSTQVESRQGAQCDFAFRIVQIVQRLGGQSDFHAQVGLAHRSAVSLEWAVRIAMVHVLNVDTAGTGTLLHQQGEQLHGWQAALADGRILLVHFVQTLELVLVGKEGFVQTGHVMWREQRDMAALDQALVQQAVDLNAVVQVTNTVFFHTTVVLQDQQCFHFQMPHGVEQGCRTTTHAALRAGLHRRLEHLEERQAACVLCFTTTNFAAYGANAATIDTDTGTLRHVTNNGAGRGIDAVQAVVTLDQHARTELASGCAHTSHDGRGQGNLELRYGVVKALDEAQTCVGWVTGEQAHGHQHVQELGAFVDALGHAVLNQVLA